MKHALLVGVPERDVEGHLERALSVEAMAQLLEALGGWSITVCTGAEATRPRVLQALDAMVSACAAQDTCLFYFFGHGGVVKFAGLDGELGRRAVFYLATLRPRDAEERVGVLDIEISDALARLDGTCGNVTAFIDCCHAASMVRSGLIPSIEPPSWVRALVEARDPALLLTAQSHPQVVRLFGSSSLRRAYATRHTEGLHGLLTQCFVALVREAGLRCDRLTWDTVALRAREWVSHERGTEEQRVVLAGPRQRVLFSPRVASQAHTAAFIPASTPGRGWIRAGLLQGVRPGDRWCIADLLLDASLQPRCSTEAQVRRVDLDSAEVVLTDPSAQPPLGAAAVMQGLERRRRVAVEGLPMLEAMLRGSGLVQTVEGGSPGPGTIAWVRRALGRERSNNSVDVLDGTGQPIWLGAATDEGGLKEVVALLEDRARADQLERSLMMASPSASRDIDVVWHWGVIGPGEEPWTLPIVAASDASPLPRIHAGDRLWLELSHRGSTPRQWFVSVLEIGIEGRLGLLNAQQPDGLEVIPGVTCHVGLRGHPRRQGLACHWPSRVSSEGPRPGRLLILASHRPFSMSHLVRLTEPDDLSAFAAQDLWLDAGGVVRDDQDRPFVTSERWAWGTIPFEVDPRPRNSSEVPPKSASPSRP